LRSRRPDDLVIRPPLPADHLEIAALIESLVPRYLARDLTPEGIALIRENAQPGAIGARLGGLNPASAWSPVFVAVAGTRIVGFGAVRNDTHITQLQIAEDWHGRGIGHRLAQALIAEIRRRHPRARAVTLNASAAGLVSSAHGLRAGRSALAVARHHCAADGDSDLKFDPAQSGSAADPR
jgi:ribosomal protein S18 acetylase RimI-like enzyme